MSELSTLVSNLNNIENILISAIEEEFGVSTEEVEPNSQEEIVDTQSDTFEELFTALKLNIYKVKLSGGHACVV